MEAKGDTIKFWGDVKGTGSRYCACVSSDSS